MSYYFLLAGSIILTVCKSSLYNVYAKKANPSLPTTFIFNALSYGVAGVIAFIATFFSNFSISIPTVICALFYAIIVVSLQTVSIVSMKVGSMSTTAICVMYGMIIPSLAGPIFWKENIGALQIVGICIMVASLWLLKDTPKEGQEKSKSIKSLALALIAFVLSGMAGVMEKIHQSTDGKSEKTTFVLIACLFMVAFSIITYFIIKTKEREKRIIPKVLYPFSSISGLIVGFYSIINLTLAGALDSMIYYPIANGGAMLLTVIISLCIFKERANVSKIIGMTLGLCGILLLSLPI
ncbi:MAG: hypothetical protein E7353_03480 [Clostridiales bacterium]|nr:hypothetical protein [Clostridiales bacterium]